MVALVEVQLVSGHANSIAPINPRVHLLRYAFLTAERTTGEEDREKRPKANSWCTLKTSFYLPLHCFDNHSGATKCAALFKAATTEHTEELLEGGELGGGAESIEQLLETGREKTDLLFQTLPNLHRQ